MLATPNQSCKYGVTILQNAEVDYFVTLTFRIFYERHVHCLIDNQVFNTKLFLK